MYENNILYIMESFENITLSEIMMHLGLEHNKAESLIIASILKKHGYESKRRMINGRVKKVWALKKD